MDSAGAGACDTGGASGVDTGGVGEDGGVGAEGGVGDGGVGDSGGCRPVRDVRKGDISVAIALFGFFCADISMCWLILGIIWGAVPFSVVIVIGRAALRVELMLTP